MIEFEYSGENYLLMLIEQDSNDHPDYYIYHAISLLWEKTEMND